MAVIKALPWGAVNRLVARRAARELEKALGEQARQHALRARPDVADELVEVQAEFEKALATLKQSKAGGGGASALYALPWYVIIGPPASGKSTALRSSELRFPYLSERTGGAVRGIHLPHGGLVAGLERGLVAVDQEQVAHIRPPSWAIPGSPSP